ncbi:hypothetical protein VSU19_08090 [Verrucomicrobiales bacterium BCK34]|nr:hypothetical protein [Verrucomicrobiales bacterium BCK34]
MKHLLTISFSGILLLLLTGCTKDDEFRVGGVPAWLATGAKIDDEPEPYRPDPAIAAYDDESGPVSFTLTPEKRNYAGAPVKKKKTTTSTRDPLERGRDYRIKRLVR